MGRHSVMKPLELSVGVSRWSVDPGSAEVRSGSRKREPAALGDPAAAVRQSLEKPLRFEALRRALTPDDRVVLVLDDTLPLLPGILLPILEHLDSARVALENITLLSPTGRRQGWIDDLPDAFQDVRTEVHDPANTNRLCYLATTKGGRRLYLNRTLVDADQIIVFSGRCFDPMFGRGGAEALLFPALANVDAYQSAASVWSPAPPADDSHPLREEAKEVAWLLGLPFFTQAVESYGDGIAAVLSGLPDTTVDGDRELDSFWRVAFAERVDTVVATLGGDPGRISFEHLARAALAAARIVKPGGRIVILSEVEVEFGEAMEVVGKSERPADAIKALAKLKIAGSAAAMMWATAADGAKLHLHARLDEDLVESLFATPISRPAEVEKLLAAGKTVAILADAHKSMAEVEAGGS